MNTEQFAGYPAHLVVVTSFSVSIRKISKKSIEAKAIGQSVRGSIRLSITGKR